MSSILKDCSTNTTSHSHLPLSNQQPRHQVYLPRENGVPLPWHTHYYRCRLCQYDFQPIQLPNLRSYSQLIGLCLLTTIITGSTNTLDTAIVDLPDPTVCNYLFHIIETTTASSHPAYLLCFSRQYTSYTTNLITSLFPTLALLYPILQITDFW